MVVTHDAGPWLEETLRSLAAQTYPNLTVLVIDAASAEDQRDRVRAVLPGAHVHRLARDPGFGGAANRLIGAVRGASYYLLCHDDVALERDAVRAMVTRAERFRAGVVGPKLVSWEDPGVLLALGLGADRTGVALPLVERGELDQSQHDGLAEVFAVPSACILIRSELFERLGGFDPAMGDVGEDLDLCWRAQVAGARVTVAPDARVRHRESRAERPDEPDRRRLQVRHRLRTVLSCYRPLQLARVLPRLLVLTVVEAVAGAFGGRSSGATGGLASWWWNLRRLPQIHRRRRQLQSIRTVSDTEVRRRQAEGGARLASLLRQELDPAVAAPAEPRAGTAWPTATTVGMVAVVALAVLGARHLLTAEVPAVGELAPFPDRSWSLLEQWATGWRQAGFGSDASPPTALGLLGLLGLASGGAMDLLRTVLVLGLVPVGALGACRLAAPLRSRRATLVALVAYVVAPVPYNAIAAGSWSGLAAYTVAPWLLVALARASRLTPDPAASWPRQVLGLGLVLAVVGAFVPVVAVMAVALAVAMAAASLLCGRLRGSLRMIGLAVGAGLLAVVLHGPWLAGLPRRLADWQQVAGLDLDGETWSALELSRFWSGPYGSSPLAWGLVAAAAVALFVARDAALEWAVRGWFVALAGWAVLYAAGQRRLRASWTRAQTSSFGSIGGSAAAGSTGPAGVASRPWPRPRMRSTTDRLQRSRFEVPEDQRELPAEVCPGDDPVDEAMPEQELRALEARWGSWPMVPAPTRAPANPISALGSARFTSPIAAYEANTPPVVGSDITDTYGTPMARSRSRAAIVLASCIRARVPSCIRAPPEADTTTGGTRSASAPSAARATFSPTTAPIDPPMNPKSITTIATREDSTLPYPHTAASRRPVASWAAARRSG